MSAQGLRWGGTDDKDSAYRNTSGGKATENQQGFDLNSWFRDYGITEGDKSYYRYAQIRNLNNSDVSQNMTDMGQSAYTGSSIGAADNAGTVPQNITPLEVDTYGRPFPAGYKKSGSDIQRRAGLTGGLNIQPQQNLGANLQLSKPTLLSGEQ